MRILEFCIDGQKLIKNPDCSFDDLTLGTFGYIGVHLDFKSSEWRGMAKVAEFCQCGKNDIYSVLLQNNSCDIPDEIVQMKHWKMRVIGEKDGTRLTTNWCAVKQGG